MKHWLFFLTAVVSCAACAPGAERNVTLEACTEVKIIGTGDMRLVDMDLPMVQISGPRERVADAEVAQDAGSVEVAGEDVSVLIGCPDLRALELLGNVAADLGETAAPVERLAVYGTSALAGRGINTPDLDVRASGQGAISIADLEVGELQLLAAGESRIAVTGRAARLALEATGSGGVDAANLRVQTVVINASGQTETSVWATAHLNADARGNASVIYTGNPDVEINAEEPASVTPAG